MTDEGLPLPANLPVPEDDGAADHLKGTRLPDVELPATTGIPVRLADLDRAVIGRRISGVTVSVDGSRFVDRMPTVVATCRQQKRNVKDYLIACFEAHPDNMALAHG